VLFITFLAMHRSQLPDFSDPNFEAMMFQIKAKKAADASVQTDRVRVSSSAGRGLGRIDDRSSLQRFVTRLDRDRSSSTASTRAPRADGGNTANQDAIPTPAELVSEIVRLYVAKIDADCRDDMTYRKRQPLSDFILVCL
jgi:hypothetical protein